MSVGILAPRSSDFLSISPGHSLDADHLTDTPRTHPASVAVRRDHEAWNRLVDLDTPLLFHWSLRTGLNEADSEDLVQEVFTALLTKLRTFERQRDGSFRKW